MSAIIPRGLPDRQALDELGDLIARCSVIPRRPFTEDERAEARHIILAGVERARERQS